MRSIAQFLLALGRQAKPAPRLPAATKLPQRSFLAALTLSLAAGLAAAPAAVAEGRHDGGDKHWTGTWATAPAGVAGSPAQFGNQTLRLIVHTSIGGNQVRVKISNTFGAEPLVIGGAHVARRSAGAAIVPDTDRALTFGGQSSFTVPVGALVLSDPVNLAVPALSDLAVSIYLPNPTAELTTHVLAQQTIMYRHRRETSPAPST